jgi:predicted CXXCH cytochrome family protein
MTIHPTADHVTIGRVHIIVALLLLSMFLLIGCDNGTKPDVTPEPHSAPTSYPSPDTGSTNKTLPLPTANYVGSNTCKLCHLNTYNDWLTSNHHKAMALATPETVLGQFPAELKHHEQITQLAHQGAHFLVHTDQTSPQAAELQLKYTFGLFPLQQYLVEQPNGVLQSLPFAWDSRPANTGGQKWFHLYADENIFPGDALHWRANSHNANHMCIECHTTAFDKGAQPNGQGFTSTWQETGVGCESCHGPGSNHLAWNSSPNKEQFENKGWAIRMTSGSPSLWQAQHAEQPPRRTEAGDALQVERCAQCHSRRARIDPANDKAAFLDAFLPSLLEPGLYYPDGQIHEEVFEYGSFLQSRMHAAGVTCSNCHNPHNGKLKIEGNGLCLQCHQADYDSEKHTRHPVGTAGSACVDCHMPSTTYMQVDARRDHSFRIPRPDLTHTLNVPDACQQCHTGKEYDRVTATLPKTTSNTGQPPHYGELFLRAQRNDPAVFDALTALLRDPHQAAMVRATAASLLTRFPTRNVLPELERALGSDEALVRLGALQACDALAPEQRQLVAPLLRDRLKAVRIEAARLISAMPEAAKQPGYKEALAEYENSQWINRDRAPALVSLALLAMQEQRWQEAENYLKEAIQKEPWFVPASVNLADLLRSQQRDIEGGAILEAALKQAKNQPDLNLSYGLWLVRQKQTGSALIHLETASRNSENPQHHYIYAVALEQAGKRTEARAVLDQAATRLAWDREIQMARVEYAIQSGDTKSAQKYVQEWVNRDKEDTTALQLQQQMSRKN